MTTSTQNATIDGFEVRFNEDGRLSLRQYDGETDGEATGGDGVRTFDSILGVLEHLRSQRPRGQSRMTVYGHDGRKLIEAFV